MVSFARLLPGGAESMASFARFRSRSHRDPSAILAGSGLFRAFVDRPVGPAAPIQPKTVSITHVELRAELVAWQDGAMETVMVSLVCDVKPRVWGVVIAASQHC